MCNMRTIGPAVSEEKIFEIVDDDGRRTDDGRGNREADQRLCFRYTDSTLPLLPNNINPTFQASSLLL